MDVMLWLLAGLLIIAGTAGTVLPMLPGVPLVFGGLLLAAWLDGFQRVGWPIVAVLAVLTLASLLVDFAAASLGARRVGASRAAVIGAALGTLVGLFFGLPGLLLGPFVGAAVGQLMARPDVIEAGRVGFGAWIGFLVGSLAKLALAVLMVVVFAVAYFV